MGRKSTGDRKGGLDGDWEELWFLSQPARATVVRALLAHTEAFVTVPELAHASSLTERAVEYHLGKLVERGLAEKRTVARSGRPHDIPRTFYALTEYGRDLAKRDDRLGGHASLDDPDETPPRIRKIERAERPTRS